MAYNSKDKLCYLLYYDVILCNNKNFIKPKVQIKTIITSSILLITLFKIFLSDCLFKCNHKPYGLVL